MVAKFDLPGRYVWRCQILHHEDHDMMRPFEVQVVAVAARRRRGRGRWRAHAAAGRQAADHRRAKPKPKPRHRPKPKQASHKPVRRSGPPSGGRSTRSRR